ncbi:MAG: N-acetylmuramoyl-L-alanine amidase [Opitutae bacterium]|nr:N-acetylmuramoyl-L-alanine amidase [Opitutae bacterium]
MKTAPLAFAAILAALLFTAGCATRPGTPAKRKGDEIVVAGQLFHTGAKVVTWMDPGGYDAYRVERRFSPLEESDWESTKAAMKDIVTPNRYSLRTGVLTPAEVERLRGGGWDLPTLQRVVDQFVLHYDVCGISKQCFRVLHDFRGLSVHFMLDIDGTIYQTLDLKERARHATIANDRSIGIEIANMGAYGANDLEALNTWYGADASGRLVIKVPEKLGDPMIRTKGFTGSPARAELVKGNIQGQDLQQYDLTPQQYAALIKLTATLNKVFPKITLDYPRGPDGRLLPRKLPAEELAKYQGVLGHYHIQTNKTDPGPALQWDTVINGARRLRRLPALPTNP